MRRLQLLSIFLMLSAFSFGQNQNKSVGNVQGFINNPISQFGGQEIFRFQQGVITQLNSGNGFGFSNDRWLSLGELNTGTQTVFGLRFQLPRRGVTFGYQDIEDTNPRIQWIYEEEGIGDLEFRVADDFMSTNSDLVATMRNDTGTVFGLGDISQFEDAKVGIIDFNFKKALEIVHSIPENDSFNYGVDVLHDTDSQENFGFNSRIIGNASNNNFGYNSIIDGNALRNYGYNTVVSGTAGRNFGLHAIVNGEATFNAGVIGNASNAQVNYGVYGLVDSSGGISNNPGDFAGFFSGDLGTTGGFFAPSDKRLKENVSDIEFATNNLMKLKPKMYEYINSDKINLSQGQQFGFIAQELEEVFPELIKNVKKPVFDDDGNITDFFEYKSVNYIPLIAVLTASVQELTKEVEDLKTTKTTLVYSSRFTDEELAKIKANGYQLEQNVPNPFSGATSITYSLPENAPQASIMIFDLSGKLLKTYKLKERAGQLRVNQSDLGKAGMYLYSLFAGGQEIMTKRMLVK